MEDSSLVVGKGLNLFEPSTAIEIMKAGIF